jgi:1-acyl-sn-glycerol-3-phosphate acyltransferase
MATIEDGGPMSDRSIRLDGVVRRVRRLAQVDRLRRPFPYGRPPWPQTVPQPHVDRNIAAEFDTEWARTPAARLARAVILDNVIRPAVKLLANPQVGGLDRLERLDGPVIFAANHGSHLDTPLLLAGLPERFRHKTVVAAAADYFFDRPLKARFNALTIAAFPVDRTTVSRRSLELAGELLADGWNLIIYPEGGRTPDGWAQEFRGGAAFLARRSGVAIVPVHLEGTRRILRKGEGVRGLRPSTTHVTFGRSISPEGLDTKQLSAVVERAVAVLADEQASDWWTARRRAAAGTTPPLRGPEVGAWRRVWELGESRRRPAGVRWPA